MLRISAYSSTFAYHVILLLCLVLHQASSLQINAIFSSLEDKVGVNAYFFINTGLWASCRYILNAVTLLRKGPGASSFKQSVSIH